MTNGKSCMNKTCRKFGNETDKNGIFCIRCDLESQEYAEKHDLAARCTEKILNISKDRNFRVQFYITGVFAKAYPGLIKKIADDGHAVGSHTYSHRSLLSDEEVLRKDILMAETVFNEIGVNFQGMGAPGCYRGGLDGNAKSQDLLKELGYKWVSSEADLTKPMEHLQARRYQNGLIEFPVLGRSDATFFRPEARRHRLAPDENPLEEYDVPAFTQENFIGLIKRNLQRSAERRLYYCLVLHPHLMDLYECETVLTAVTDYAKNIGCDILTHGKVCNIFF